MIYFFNYFFLIRADPACFVKSAMFILFLLFVEVFLYPVQINNVLAKHEKKILSILTLF